MTREEFDRWINQELRKRLPDTYGWLAKQTDTASIWYAEVFCKLDYDLCMSALSHVWSEGLAAYDRERLPSIIAKRHGEIAWQRQQTEQRVAQRKRQGDGTFHGDPIMMRATREAAKIKNRRVRRMFIYQLFDNAEDVITDGEIFWELNADVHDDLTQDDCTPGVAHSAGHSAARAWKNEMDDGIKQSMFAHKVEVSEQWDE